jgi:uncharacterized protein (TIGR02284 family)
MNPIDTQTLLNRLIVMAKDGESALTAAAEEAYHEELKTALTDYARFFHDAATELQDQVRALGGEPRGRGSFENTLHRTWLHLKSMAFGHDERVILDEVEAEESLADTLYAEAPLWDLPEDVRRIIDRQAAEARQRHQQIRRLRESLPAT